MASSPEDDDRTKAIKLTPAMEAKIAYQMTSSEGEYVVQL